MLYTMRDFSKRLALPRLQQETAETLKPWSSDQNDRKSSAHPYGVGSQKVDTKGFVSSEGPCEAEEAPRLLKRRIAKVLRQFPTIFASIHNSVCERALKKS